ncbi:MAG: class I SAM-dependent methyltransferase [Actinomycetota bacterium]
MISNTLARLGAASPQMKRWLWRSWYQFMASRYRQADWKFMNYGYSQLAPDAEAISLEQQDEADRYAIQLYHHVAAAVPLKGKSVLEVGCGRGGGSAYVAGYLQPSSVTGLDFSDSAVEFCRRTHTNGLLRFVQGDAESLPFEDGSIDAVLNVESSHCYPSLPRFVAEAYRVLRPGGHFLWADMCRTQALEENRGVFTSAGFVLERETLITPNVLEALNRVQEQRSAMIRRLVPKFLERSVGDFAGVPGTRVYESLRAGEVQYVSRVLSKPQA